jgi:hypothetical protein
VQQVAHQPHAGHQLGLALGLDVVLLLVLLLVLGLRLALVQLPQMFQLLLLLLSRVLCPPLLQPHPTRLAVPAHHSLQQAAHQRPAAHQLGLVLALALALLLLLLLVQPLALALALVLLVVLLQVLLLVLTLVLGLALVLQLLGWRDRGKLQLLVWCCHGQHPCCHPCAAAAAAAAGQPVPSCLSASFVRTNLGPLTFPAAAAAVVAADLRDCCRRHCCQH